MSDAARTPEKAGSAGTAPPKKPPERPGLTLRSGCAGAVLVVIWIVLLGYFVHNNSTSQQQLIIIMGFGAMVTLFGLKRLLGLLPESMRLDRHEMVIVYAMLLAAIPLTMIYRGFTESGIHQLHPEKKGQKSYPWVPAHYSTRDEEAIRSFNYGVGDKSLGEVAREVSGWVLPAAYWGVTVLAFGLSALGLILIFRRKWIEEDRLQFPWATVPTEIANEPYRGDEGAASFFGGAGYDAAARRRQLAGFLIGLAICVPGLAGAVSPSLASRIAVPPNPQSFGVDLTEYGIVPGNVVIRVALEPFALFMLLLLPLDVLISAAVTYVGLRIALPNALIFAGMPAYTDRIYKVLMYTMIRAGFMIGVPFWSIFFAREYLLGVMRRAGVLGVKDPADGAVGRALACLAGLCAGLGAMALLWWPPGLASWAYVFGAVGLWWLLFCPKSAVTARSAFTVPVLLAPLIVFLGTYFAVFDPAWGLPEGLPETDWGAFGWWRVFPSGRTYFWLLLASALYYALLARSLGWPWKWAAGIRRRVDEEIELRDADPADERAGSLRSVMLFSISTIAFIALISWGMSPTLLFIALAFIFLANFTYARMRAQGAWGIMPPWHMMKLDSHFMNTLGLWGSPGSWHNAVNVAAFGVDARCLGPATHLMESFKLADSTRTRRRDILLAIGIAAALVLLLTIPVFLCFAYTFGYDGTSAVGGDWAHYSMWTYFGNTWGTREASKEFLDIRFPVNRADYGNFNLAFFMLMGTGLVGAIMYLRREFIWFPLSPVGCFLGATIGGISHLGVDRIWFTVLVAFGLKAIVFKWYGVRIFQQKILPVVIHILMGMVAGMIIYLVIWALKGQGVWV